MDTLLIRNGTVVNAEDGTCPGGYPGRRKQDPEAEPGICDRAVSEIDATGCYVTPGLVDHHTHIYPMASIGSLERPSALVLESQRLWMPGARAAGPMNDTGPGSVRLSCCLPLHPCEHRGAFQPSGGHGGCGSAPYGRGGDPGAVPAVRE